MLTNLWHKFAFCVQKHLNWKAGFVMGFYLKSIYPNQQRCVKFWWVKTAGTVQMSVCKKFTISEDNPQHWGRVLWKGEPSTLWLSPSLYSWYSIFSYRPVLYMQIHDFVRDLSKRRVLVASWKLLGCYSQQYIQLVFKLVFQDHKGKLLVYLVRYQKHDKVEDQTPSLHEKLHWHSLCETPVYLVSPQKQKLLKE